MINRPARWLRIAIPVVWAAIAFPAAAAQEVEIAHLRVGQGDATLIRGPVSSTGERVTILFDAGNLRGPDGGSLITAALASRGIRTIDHVVVSHYDADHIGGIIAGGNHGTSFLLGPDGQPGLAGDDDGDGSADWLGSEPFFSPDPQELGTGDDVRVRRFVDRGDDAPPSSAAFRKYRGMAGAVAARVSIRTLADVEGFEIDLGGGARFTALAANGFVRGRQTRVPQVNTENEKSLSFLLTYGTFDYLISGDLIGRSAGAENARVEAAVGEYLIANGISVDVLHANHHGADNGSETDFLNAVRPEIVIISAGNRNTHEHPSQNALRRMAAAGVYRIVQTEWGSTPGVIDIAVRDRQAIYQDDVIITATPVSYTLSMSRGFATDND